MAGKAIHYYACGNTAKGFISLLDTNLTGLTQLYLLKDGLPSEKTALMKEIGADWQNRGLDIEYLHCSRDQDALDGVIIPALMAGILDGTPPHAINISRAETMDCGCAEESGKCSQQLERIQALNWVIDTGLSAAYAAFAAALRTHDDWEAIYISNMDVAAHSKVTQLLIDRILADNVLDKPTVVRHRFMGGATPAGPVDYIPNLTQDITKRFFLKGRPGTGKSTLLKKLAAAAEIRGFDVENYHCGFDPDSMDMVILRELGVAVIDTTAPHEYFPSRDSDEIIDLYQEIIKPGTDEAYEAKLKEITRDYKLKIAEGTACLEKVKASKATLDGISSRALHPIAMKEAKEKIQRLMESVSS